MVSSAASSVTRAKRRPRAVAQIPPTPAIVMGSVTHVRRQLMQRSFRNSVHEWLIDLDAVPTARRPWSWLASFRSVDHIGDQTASIRENVEAFTALNGIDVTGCRILMLANARSFGYVFDPLTVHWCLSPSGQVVCVVAEVHNTYGERHCYLLQPDATGRATIEKSFYVSPFVTLAGEYEMRFTLAPDRVAVSIVLRQDGEVAFTAAFTGTPQAATRAAVLRATLRHPFMPQRVSALIRWHGIRLWLRRVPIVSRQPHVHQEGVR